MHVTEITGRKLELSCSSDNKKLSTGLSDTDSNPPLTELWLKGDIPKHYNFDIYNELLVI